MTGPTGPTWQCSDCDTFNDAAARVCDVCETPRRAKAAKPVPGPRAEKSTASGKTPPKRSTARTPPAEATPYDELPPVRPVDPDPTEIRSVLDGLGWMCPNCGRQVFGYVCDRCHLSWTPEATTTVRGSSPRPRTTSRPSPSPGPVFPKPPPREATREEIVAGCGCLLFLAAVAVTLVVLLILNWSTVTSFLTGSDSTKGAAKPSPTVSASGPCPEQLAALLPKGTSSGARLVAAYSRDNVKDRYAFCRTKAGKVFYFFAKKTGERYGTPSAAEKSGTGYLVRFPDSSFRFRDLEVTAYGKDGKELWKEELTPEAAVD